MPLDVIIIMLGTNDLKTTYNRTADDVALALKQYPEYVVRYCADRNMKQPRIILASPTYMDEKAPKFVESMPKPGVYDKVSAQKSRQFAEPIKRVAEENGCEFFDAAPITKTGEDGCHLDLESHKYLGDNFAKLIKEEVK